MPIIWIVFIAIVVIFFSIAFWLISRNVSDTLADIRHGKGIFLTFNYTPEEWEYYTETLPMTGHKGKVCFTRNHIYISDGTEEILYEIFGSHLREISRDSDFVVFTVRTKDPLVTESGKEIPDSPDNLRQFHIFVPKAQQQQKGELIGFYQKIIDKNKKERDNLRSQQKAD
jgi:hypothetical protein